MATYGSVEYKVVTGTVAAIATFNANVEAEINNGYAPIVEPQTDGTDISQVLAKGSSTSFVSEYEVDTATDGTAGNGSFTVDGDQTLNFHAGYRFTVVNATGNNGANNGVYSVKNGGSTYDENTQKTTIPVNEAVDNNTADGSIIGYAP